MASIEKCMRMLAVLLTMATLALSQTSVNETGYDRTCFLPPSKRTSNEDQLLLFDFSLPPSTDALTEEAFDYLAFPTGTCGVELFFRNPHLYLSPELLPTIKNITTNFFPKFCTQHYVNSNQTSPLWRFDVITTGTQIFGVPSRPLVPDEELSRVPDSWLTSGGILIRITTDSLAAAGKLIIRCNAPYLFPVPDSIYNVNFTFEINGCPSGKYDSRCEKLCNCAEGVECHSFNGICMCPRGLRRIRCDQRDPELATNLTQGFISYGESSNLTCTTYGMSPSNWSWTKEGQTTPLETVTWEKLVPYSPRPTMLVTTIYAESTSANGGYVCEVRDENGTIYRQLVNVTVIAIPDPFIQVPENCTTLAGKNVTFTCQTKADAGRIKWVKGRNQTRCTGAEIKDKPGRYEILSSTGGVCQLCIYGVEFADEDVYSCCVGHAAAAQDLSYVEALLVVQSAPRADCSFQDIIDVRSGHLLTLWCILESAKPVPTLTWTVEGRQKALQPVSNTRLSGDDSPSNVNSSVTFEPAPEDDGKRISVTVVSPVVTGNQEVVAFLNVTYAPIVTISPDPLTLTTSQDAMVKCDAKSNPKPTTYTWTLRKKNKLISNSPSSNGPTYHFKTVRKKYDNASLTCVVRNSIGETEMSVLIKVVETRFSPGAIAGFSVAGGLFLAVLVLASCVAHRYRKDIKLWRAKRAGKDKVDEKEYDVFISYKSGSPDEEFVIHHLIPRLEQDGYRICVHYKSFLPGKSIIDNISDAVHRSRKTLLLLSPGFIESEWCRYEFKAALSQMLRLRTDLIPVIFEDLGPQENLFEDLQTILRRLTCIMWPNDPTRDQYQTDEDRQQFWKLLGQALPDNPLDREGPGHDHHPEREEHVCETSLGMNLIT
ncbi:uncharacterized protein LOC119721908 [Patiria miniata]|uniref:Uncharacterized protein n=1 Tax=Patiria miniata TaxID=46514 RepID=A0A913Z7R9_PATMI|nr:uncharacterized protein LOC119721908 [Patiria miniata]